MLFLQKVHRAKQLICALLELLNVSRDEDLRGDRQPEFTQVDFEINIDWQKIQRHHRRLDLRVIEGNKRASKWHYHSHSLWSNDDAMDSYGSDKPDLLVLRMFIPSDEVVKGVDFKVFSAPAVKPLSSSATNNYSRKDIDKMTEVTKQYGAKGALGQGLTVN